MATAMKGGAERSRRAYPAAENLDFCFRRHDGRPHAAMPLKMAIWLEKVDVSSQVWRGSFMSETIFRETIEVCDRAFQTLEAQIPAPIRVRYGDDFVFRYEKHTLEIVTIQKLSQPTLGAMKWPQE